MYILTINSMYIKPLEMRERAERVETVGRVGESTNVRTTAEATPKHFPDPPRDPPIYFHKGPSLA